MGHGDENVRTITLPTLPDAKEGEIGPLAAGDWITLITPLMKDLSAASSAWWEVVFDRGGLWSLVEVGSNDNAELDAAVATGVSAAALA